MNENTLIRHMVGREIDNIYPKRTRLPSEEVILEIRDWGATDPGTGRKVLKQMNLKLKKGEILGIAGLMGSGRTELARSIFGNPDGYGLEGKLLVKGTPRRFGGPKDAILAGVAYASEDRKKNGLILIQDVMQNITLANLREISARGVLDSGKEIQAANHYRDALSIKTPSINQTVMNLSGGNQQKVSVAKWLFVEPDVLIFDEPTRGIDVGRQIRDLSDNEQARRARHEHHHDLVGTSGNPGNERQDLHCVLGQDHGRIGRRRSHPGKNHAACDELGEGMK